LQLFRSLRARPRCGLDDAHDGSRRGHARRDAGAGVEWTFETYPEYLDTIRRKASALNYSGFVGHTAVRQWVMGDAPSIRPRLTTKFPACARSSLTRCAQGAIGFSFDRSPSHRGDGGRRVPSVVASQSEVEALMMVTRDLGRGVIQCSPGEGLPLALRIPIAARTPHHVDFDPRVPSR
jgi:N-acyl-D-aspartate/D-glutamate deacylase